MTLLQKIKNLTWWNEINKLKDILLDVISGFVEDAPKNNSVYGRKNGEWTVISSDGIVATQEWVTSLLDGNRNEGMENIVLDGLTTVYNVPHGLGVIPSFAYAGRGNSENFDVFNTTWDTNNIIITYQNPPLAGNLTLNWIALK